MSKSGYQKGDCSGLGCPEDRDKPENLTTLVHKH